MSKVPTVQHPGPIATERISVVPCRATRQRVKLSSGSTLLQAMIDAAEGAGAWFDLTDVPIEKLTFVCPAPAPDDSHVAWYSDETVLPRATIRQAGAHLGRRNGEAFAHVHGLWDGETGTHHAGHLLAEKTVLATDHMVDAWMLDGAIFKSAPDEETGFTLFRPSCTHQVGTPNAVLGTIRPNELIDEGIAKCSEVAGLCASTVKGLGSLVGTRLKDQSALNDIATEVLLIGPTAQQVTAVGFDGAPISGELVPLMNRVCVTFEVLLVAQSE
ncbi:hypothetical protein HKX17_17010 [Sulfitobacter sp. KE34]|nr:hypothetical protein [Sulfitobacter sp. KE12]MDF3355521.1 hypothetical protein [Sulfitobacter sp. KE27]MDF3359169.1 hypothetical protein [Sulfitobacter sp. KE33]MDF3366593.1 hypothetical protein [Sulfitobacter sp. Ks34]MDF3370202.1 hypothetical protein [Sulfitobacter sp. Ks43]MDF3373884.1 hypothetical protein [Sulfitobacter sp. KS8]MDF3377488.1 hypothetical protein [Sulfitobacter sp. KE37]MDF3381154.1 hypothetical protein [Sulfitobacter sp. KE32]MDF3395021.1 hypothetical protein [Sulfito